PGAGACGRYVEAGPRRGGGRGEPLLGCPAPGLRLGLGGPLALVGVDLVDACLGVGRPVAVALHALGDGLVLEDAGREVQLLAQTLEAIEPAPGAAGPEDARCLVDELLADVGLGPVSCGAQQVVDHRVAEWGTVL